ncbi:MAG: hypothetical protein EA402_05120 [Planctomycetota bacterium]|nr:MAG: hypothetical protein EA402_05120 [Planctomycetota bacterium]
MDGSELIEAVARITGHRFADFRLLEQGMTHASWCSHQSDPDLRRAAHNERLEFLGDAMLGAAVGYVLYRRFPEADEGFLSRCKSTLVSRKVLAQAMDRCGLMPHARLGMQMNGGIPLSVRANLAEGLLGAVFLDGGWPALLCAVSVFLKEDIELAQGGSPTDAKNHLQSWCLEHHGTLPSYRCERRGGSDHAPRFVAVVEIADLRAEGEASSRRRAEAKAAAQLLDDLRQQIALQPPGAAQDGMQ